MTDGSSQRRLRGRSSGGRRSGRRKSCVLKPSKMDCVEKFELLETHIDYTIYIVLWKPPKEVRRKEFRRKEVELSIETSAP